MNKRPAYLLPTGEIPEDMICIPVYVPNDARCIGAFWGQYDDLTTWVAWEQDSEKRAKDVAAAFKIARDKARDQWIEQGGCGGDTMLLRQSPDNACLIEKSEDQGETWETLVDMSLCKNTPYDPYHGETLPQEAPVAAAAAIILELMWLLQNAIDEQAREDIHRVYPLYLRTWTNNDASEAGSVWLDGLEDHYQDINDYGDITPWLPLYNYLACHMQSSRTPECNSVFCWLNEAAEDLYTWLNESSEWVFNKLEATARALGPAGLSSMATAGGITGFGGIEELGEPDCEWEIVLTPEQFEPWVMDRGVYYQENGTLTLSDYWGGGNDYWCWIAGIPGGTVNRLQSTSAGPGIDILTYTEDPEGWVTQRSDQHIEIAYNPSDQLAWGEFTSYDWHVKEWAFQGEEQGDYLYRWQFPDTPENTPLDLSKLVFHIHRDVDNFDDRIVSITIRGKGIKPTWE